MKISKLFDYMEVAEDSNLLSTLAKEMSAFDWTYKMGNLAGFQKDELKQRHAKMVKLINELQSKDPEGLQKLWSEKASDFSPSEKGTIENFLKLRI